MQAAFVQMYSEFGNVEKNVLHALQLVQSKPADLYVLPELFNTGYFFKDRDESAMLAEPVPDGPTCKALTHLAMQKQCYIVAGLAEKDGDKVYNSSFISGPDGFIAVYRKIHLFKHEKEWFDDGDKPFFVVDVMGYKVGLMICFDWIFPESMRSLTLLGADLIAHPSNLVMPYCQNAMVTRCLENRVFVITANRIGSDVRGDNQIDFTGQSQITGTGGEIMYRAPVDREDVHVMELDLSVSRNKHINPQNDLLADRRPELYTL